MKLQTLFACDKALFFQFAVTEEYAVKYGYNTLLEMWANNPTITLK